MVQSNSQTAKRAKPGTYRRGRRAQPPATDGTDYGFTALEAEFCRQYLIDLNAAAAYRRAGGAAKTAHQAGSRMLKQAHIQARVTQLQQERSQRTELAADDVLREWARIAFFDIRALYHEDGRLKEPHELDADTARAVHALKVFEEFDGQGEGRQKIGEVREYKVIDKHTALTNMARHLGLFNDRVEVTGEIGLGRILQEIDGGSLGPPGERGRENLN